jgi:hypothetical protein
MQQRLQQHGYQLSLSARVIGNETEIVFQHCRAKSENGKDILINPKTEEQISAMVIYHAVADSENVNCSPFSVKDYHYTSRLNVSDSLWNDYHMFGRHHWKALIPKCKDEKELRKMADIVLSWSDDYGGKLIPVSVLRNKLKGEDGSPAMWERKLKTATNACKRLGADDAAPAFVRSAARGFLTSTTHPPLP